MQYDVTKAPRSSSTSTKNLEQPEDTIMTQNSVSRQLHRTYCTENQLLNNHKHNEM